MKRITKAAASLTVLAIISGCQANLPVNTLTKQNLDNHQVNTGLSGSVDFTPRLDSEKSFNTKVSLPEISNGAAVSIITFSENPVKTIASGITDRSGNFIIQPSKAFAPNIGDIFILEAIKRISTLASGQFGGNDLLSLRTYIQWTGSGWNSITGSTIKINEKTTTYSVIDFYDSTINAADCIGKIDSNGNISPVGAVGIQKINEVTGLVNQLLVDNADPIRFITFQNNKYIIKSESNHALNYFLNSNKCSACDLSNVNLSNRNLSNADLSSAILKNGDFRNTNLTGANLAGADLTGADFSGAIWSDGKKCKPGSIGSCNNEFRVNTYTTNSQRNTKIATDNAGNFIITWESLQQDGSGWGIYAQRYNAAGEPQGNEFQVNSFTTYSQRYPSVAMDSTGDFVITWASGFGSYGAMITSEPAQDGNGYGVFAQRYNAAGIPQGSEFQVNTYTTGIQTDPSVSMDQTGNFIIAWSGNQSGNTIGISAQRFNAAGVPQGTEFKVNSSNYRGDYPVTAMDSNGDFVVAWRGADNQDGSGFGIYARRYNAAGVSQGTEFQVNTYTTYSQENPAVAMDAAGDFVITWTSSFQVNNSVGIYAQRYNASGIRQGTEFRVNSATTGNNNSSSVSMDNSGNFVISWTGTAGILARRYNLTGAPQGSEILVDENNIGRVSAVRMDPLGNFIVAFEAFFDKNNMETNNGIYARMFDPSGGDR